jgi:hypothetical protein
MNEVHFTGHDMFESKSESESEKLFENPDVEEVTDSTINPDILRFFKQEVSEASEVLRQRQLTFIASLPEEAVDALYCLRRLSGAESFAEMFATNVPSDLERQRQLINKLDIQRIWNSANAL